MGAFVKLWAPNLPMTGNRQDISRFHAGWFEGRCGGMRSFGVA